MPLMTARVVWNAPLRLASSTASQSASLKPQQEVVPGQPGVVHQDVDRVRAPLPRPRSRPRPAPPSPRRRRSPRARSPSSAATACGLARLAAHDRHLGPGAVQRARDRESDAARAAGDEGDLAGEVDGRSWTHHARNFSTSSAVPSVTAGRPGHDPLEQPATARCPGPISTKVGARAPAPRPPACSPPSAPARSAARPAAACASAPVRTGSRAGVGDDREASGPRTARRVERVVQAGHRRRHEGRVERPAHLEREHPLGARAPCRPRPRGRRPAGSPEMTVWSGALRLAATATPSGPEASLQAASTSSVARPSTAAIAPGRGVPASYISSPRRRTRRAASVGAQRAGRHVGAVLAQAVARAGAARPRRRSLAPPPRPPPSARGSRAGRCGSG